MSKSTVKIKDILIKKELKISVAESLTAGLLQTEIAKMSGALNFFLGGLTTYSIDTKVALLKVDRAEAEAHNAVSPLVAEQMAKGVCNLFKSDIGLSTTGYAEPEPEIGVLSPFAYISICINAKRKKVYSKKVEGKDLSRKEMNEYVVKSVLEMLLKEIEQ